MVASIVGDEGCCPITIDNGDNLSQASIPDTPSAQEGCIDILLLNTRVSVRGRVDFDVLQTVLATLSQR
jgi:hypothetical protein